MSDRGAIETRSFKESFLDVTSKSPKLNQREYSDSGLHPVIDQGQKSIAGYTNESQLLTTDRLPLIAFGDHTRRFKFIEEPFVVGADGVKLLQALPGLDPRYAFHFLRTLQLPDAGYSRHFKFLREVRVPIPPLPEQRRIAAILDEASGLIDASQENLGRLGDLKMATYASIFGPGRNSVPTSALASLGRVVTGKTPPGGLVDMYGSEIPFVTPADLGASHPYKRGLSAAGATFVRTVKEGSLLVCCIGAVGKMDIARGEVAFNQQINAVDWFPGIQPRYGRYAVEQLQSEIVAKAARTTLPILNKTRFSQLEIPVPPQHLQDSFESQIMAIETVEEKLQQRLNLCHELFATLQQETLG